MHTVVGISCIAKHNERPRPLRRGDGGGGGGLPICACVVSASLLSSPPVCDLVGSSIWVGTQRGEWGAVDQQSGPGVIIVVQTSDFDKPAAECGSPAMSPGDVPRRAAQQPGK